MVSGIKVIANVLIRENKISAHTIELFRIYHIRMIRYVSAISVDSSERIRSSIP